LRQLFILFERNMMKRRRGMPVYSRRFEFAYDKRITRRSGKPCTGQGRRRKPGTGTSSASWPPFLADLAVFPVASATTVPRSHRLGN